MWVVRLVHPTVNKFRVIAEHTREAAEQEAAKQIKAWDAEFSAIIATASAVARGEKRWLDPKAMKRLLSPEHRLRELAEQLTAQVQAELTALGFLLKFGALLKYTVQWGPLSAPALDKLEPDLRSRATSRTNHTSVFSAALSRRSGSERETKRRTGSRLHILSGSDQQLKSRRGTRTAGKVFNANSLIGKRQRVE